MAPDVVFRYPVLIIPGFMSSGMEVRESDTKSWVGKRVWINLNSLGFESLHRGSALDINESLRLEGESSSYSEETHREYERQFTCKSRWLQHMSLSNDMLTERPNIEVRPIDGLNGVDYLTPGALTNHLSYVFGPLIRALQETGYTDNNLDASTYDWRLPPSELEKRDQYFTSTMRKVEQMYQRNNNTPVVLLCHSLGCKTGHYFLNFAKDQSGEDWIKKHIHAYMPVGAPHLGAPKAVRGIIDGDKMGLDAFLNDEEGLILGRSLGSCPWLAPREIPRKTPPVVFIRKEGILEITVPPIDCSDLLRERKDSPPKLRLAIIFGKDVLTSDFQSAKVIRGKCMYEFPGTFQFPTTADIPASQSKEGMVQFALQEPGLKGAKNEAQKEKTLYDSPVCCPLRCAVEILLCPFKYVLCLPCTLAGCIISKSYELTVDVAHLTAAAVGAGTNVATSAPFSMASAITSKRRDAKVKNTLCHVLEDKSAIFKSRRKAHISARLRWLPPKDVVRPVVRQMSPVALLPKGSAYTMSVKHHKKKHVSYDISDGCELLSNEGMDTMLALISDRYEKDALGPRTRSAADAPPVDRVVAIFGVNKPTELGAVYRRRCIIVKDDHRVQKLHTLDSSARLVSNKGGLSLKGGILLETEKGAGKSGDGTVPYWSMNHCRSWKDSCKLKVIELQGADHREILADPNFHQTVIDYVTPKR